MGTEVPRSSATLGRRPIITNSVVPMPKALTASASRARGMRETFPREGPAAALRGPVGACGHAEGREGHVVVRTPARSAGRRCARRRTGFVAGDLVPVRNKVSQRMTAFR
ncbi:hypothetical protein JCM13580A_47500 [Streptomyces drozdowiczii]